MTWRSLENQSFPTTHHQDKESEGQNGPEKLINLRSQNPRCTVQETKHPGKSIYFQGQKLKSRYTPRGKGSPRFLGNESAWFKNTSGV